MTRILALCLGIVLGMAGCVSMLPKPLPESAYYDLSVLVEFMGDGHCTGTKAGPHLVLIASHCVRHYPGAVLIDGEPANIVSTHLGEGDQAAIEVDITFDRWAEIGPTPQVGDELFFVGNPGEGRRLLRRGYVSGFQLGWIVVDINVGKGDSGSAVFNDRGQIVGVVSGFYQYEMFVIALIQPVVAWQ